MAVCTPLASSRKGLRTLDEGLKVGCVSRDNRELMDFRGRGQESIYDFHAPSATLAIGEQFATYVGVAASIARIAPYEPLQIVSSIHTILFWRAQPDSLFRSAIRQGDSAEKQAIFIRIRRPSDHTRVRNRLDPLGNDVRIKQKTHRSTRRIFPLIRFSLRPEPRSGELAKNSARLPLRLVLRSHSSAATITTVVRPLRVIV